MTTLRKIASARSGDKGGDANIGVIAKTREDFDFLEKFLTAERVNRYFCRLGVKRTKRYVLPNLLAFNFVLEGVLGRCASLSLRSDAQGKALGTLLLEMAIDEVVE